MDAIKEIQNTAKDTGEFLDKLGNHINYNLFIEGHSGQKHTMLDWEKLLTVHIPQEMDLATLANLAAEVARKYQQASFHRDRQGAQLSILHEVRTNKYNDVYNSTRRESEEKFQRPLAAESCKIAAQVEVKSLDDALNSQEIIKDFWDGRCKALVEIRKHLEIIGYALSNDARLCKDFIIKGREE